MWNILKMSSSLSSRYWTCQGCFNQFDWEADKNDRLYPLNHDEKQCKIQKDKKRLYMSQRNADQAK